MQSTLETRLSNAWPPRRWANHRLLVAVSGGADSVALLRALAAVRVAGRGRLIVAHFNHRLRGAASEADQQFVCQLANQLQLGCELGAADTGLDSIRGLASEAAARRARYQFLEQTARKMGARYVATAHTADDQAETILHHVLRGTGLAGLAGMPRVRRLGEAVTLIRPLLAIPRAMLRDYLAELNQPYCDDASNRSLRYTRNRIRRDLLPRLQRQYNQCLPEALVRLGQQAAETHALLAQRATKLAEGCVRYESRQRAVVDCRLLAGEARVVLRELFVSIWKHQDWPRGPMGFDQWDRLADLALDGLPALTLPGPIHVRRNGFWLALQKVEHG